jgi:hypothetical protein
LLKQIIAGLEDDIAEKRKEIDAVTQKVKAKEEDVAKLIAVHKAKFEELGKDESRLLSPYRSAAIEAERAVDQARKDQTAAFLRLFDTKGKLTKEIDLGKLEALTTQAIALEKDVDVKADTLVKAQSVLKDAKSAQAVANAESWERVRKVQVPADREYKALLNEVVKIRAFRNSLQEQEDELRLDLARAKEKLKQLEK